jgi:DNA-binding SARP family transcriptional activator
VRLDDPTPLEISLFGPLQVRVGGAPLPRLRSRKGFWLLALLTLRAGRDVDRSWLVSTLWPESAEDAGFANLRNTLLDLRQALGPEAARLRAPTPQTLSLDLSGACADVLLFDDAIRRRDPEALEQAVALYRGPFLEGCAQSWAFEERQTREQVYLSALETLAARASATGDRTAAERYLRTVVAADPLRETAQRSLMELLATAGAVPAAMRLYSDFRLLLQRDLGMEPDAATTVLYRSLQSRARSGSSSPGSLPDADASSPAAPRHSADAAPEALRMAVSLEPVGGAVPLGSRFYVSRPVDEQFEEAIARQDSIVLIKGARQTGKTSLLARGLQQARQAGSHVVLTDLQVFNAAHLQTAEQFLLTLAHTLDAELELGVSPQEVWKAEAGANLNFDHYLRRHVLTAVQGSVVWAVDGVDRLFGRDYATEVFGLFRSWHDRRHLNPAGPWSRLTLVMAYATEAHLFITDPNQSPFNVGSRLELEDFDRSQMAELNRRHGCPLEGEAEIDRLHGLVAGHPYLVRRALYEMVSRRLDLNALEAEAERDHGLFGDHLRRLHALLLQDAKLSDSIRGVLQGRPCPSAESFYRLRAAGVLIGVSARDARLRCRLYAGYLQQRLLEE